MARPIRNHTAGARLTALSIALGALALSGCATTLQEQGRSRVPATFKSSGTLRADLSAEVGVPTALAAGEAALRAGGYVVKRRSDSGAGGEIVGAAHESGVLRHVPGRGVTISARDMGATTAVAIRVGPIGDEAESRALFERMLAALGR